MFGWGVAHTSNPRDVVVIVSLLELLQAVGDGVKERSTQRILVVDVAPVVHTILLQCVHSDAHIAHHLDSHVQPRPVKESEVGGACRWEAPKSHECQATGTGAV